MMVVMAELLEQAGQDTHRRRQAELPVAAEKMEFRELVRAAAVLQARE
jgi:hypothetical protein